MTLNNNADRKIDDPPRLLRAELDSHGTIVVTRGQRRRIIAILPGVEGGRILTSAIACRTATAHPTPSSTAPPLDCLTGRSSHVRWGSRPGHRCRRDRTPDHPRSWRRIRVGATERADVRAVSRVVAQGARSAACSLMRYGEAVEAPPSEVRWDRSSGRTVEAPPLLPGAPSLYHDETISVRVARWRRGGRPRLFDSRTVRGKAWGAACEAAVEATW